jgi:hypothetical protein
MSRLFHAIVAMGATVSVSGCGGNVRSTVGSDGDAAAGGAGAGAGGGGSGLGGSPGLGGASESGGVSGDGGSSGSGGDMSRGGAGGISLVPGPGDGAAEGRGLPDAATLAQWDCSARACLIRGSEFGLKAGFDVTEPCPWDPVRPRSAADCRSGERFECRLAYWTDGTPIVVNCQCTPAGCESCEVLPRRSIAEVPLRCDDRSKLCPCTAYTGILIR